MLWPFGKSLAIVRRTDRVAVDVEISNESLQIDGGGIVVVERAENAIDCFMRVRSECGHATVVNFGLFFFSSIQPTNPWVVAHSQASMNRGGGLRSVGHVVAY